MKVYFVRILFTVFLSTFFSTLSTPQSYRTDEPPGNVVNINDSIPSKQYVNYRRTDPDNLPDESDYKKPKEEVFPLNYFRSTGVWTELNPKVPRVSYVGLHFVNKDTGWACGGSGAIIKTTNGGDDWMIAETPVTNLLLKIHSYNGQTVLATGYDGIILRSSDGGENFELIPTGLGNDRDLWGVQMINDSVGWVSGRYGSLLKTSDAGLTWRTISLSTTKHFWAIKFFNNLGFIACDSGKVLRTTDAGTSWFEIQAGDIKNLYALDVIDTMHIVMAGAIGKNVYSSDGGNTWIQNNRLPHDELNSIKFVDNDTGYAIGGIGFGIRKTTNRGVSWFTPPVQNLSEWELQLLPGGIGYSAGSDLWINKTTAGYDNWKGLFLNANFVDVSFTDEFTGYAADGRWTGGPLYKTTDGGLNWLGLPNFPSTVFTSSLRCIYFMDSVTGFAGSAPCRIVKTTDAGETWRIVNRTGLTDTIGLINKFFFVNKNIGWAVTTRGGILKTTDAGENWIAQLNAGISVNFQSIHFVDSLYGWTANAGRRPHKTTDGGNNWVHQTNLDIWITNDIYFESYYEGWIVDQTSWSALKKTTDGGLNWTVIPNVINSFKFHFFPNQNHWLISGSPQKYITEDGGDTWIDITNDVPSIFNNFNAVTNKLGFAVGSAGLVLRYDDTVYIPVELISFEGEVEDDKIILSWSTGSELNNLGFYVEKSYDKLNWETIGFINGKGTTTEISYYNFIDNKPLNREINYRLRQVDFDGTFKYSKIITVHFNNYPLTFELFQNFPNPFNPSTTIKYHLPKDGFVTLKIFDILGREIKTLVNEQKSAGRYEVNFNAASLASGVYIYRMEADDFNSVRKLLLLK